ncbi:MAG TPA: TlpA disulfide reductase family protein [Luteimonas sp.]|nr:TlpA disulfide reductase family protein [Luteimonas sp.]HRO26582.1 TlpA disulfide reductase family protein [Luteimonas sp.]HRP71814.1 TlpA disulfide reductase family protein [Luteimonas sp.]
MSSVGPFAMHTVLVAVAALLAWWLARSLGGRVAAGCDVESGCAVASTQADHARCGAGRLFIDTFFVGLLAARLGYVLRWWPEYAATPKSIIAIGDGGFAWWIGLPAAVAFAWWRTRSPARLPLRRPVMIGIAAGMLVWFAANATLTLLRNSAPPLPDIELATLDGRPTTLSAYAGRPVVLNMWATWCPPCRREMPVLEDAQHRYPDVAIVLVNQGEDRAAIGDYLAQQGLALDHVLLDPHSRTMLDTNTRGLPTTLFFDANGRLVDTHMGELTRASLADTLRKRFAKQGSE